MVTFILQLYYFLINTAIDKAKAITINRFFILSHIKLPPNMQRKIQLLTQKHYTYLLELLLIKL